MTGTIGAKLGVFVVTSEEKVEAIINAIAQASEERWGEGWEVHLIRSYCRIESEERGEKVTPKNRRTMLMRALDQKSCAAETLLRLASAAAIEIQVHRTLN
ncbi:MAG: hypothetical protein AAFZ49_00155 [Cyanobacteria bacterium J06659_2]